VESANLNFEGLGQTKSAGGKVVFLVIRPQEVVAAIQALAQAYNSFYGTVADYNRAQFRLYRALGQPAQFLTGQGLECSERLTNGNPGDRTAPQHIGSRVEGDSRSDALKGE